LHCFQDILITGPISLSSGGVLVFNPLAGVNPQIQDGKIWSLVYCVMQSIFQCLEPFRWDAQVWQTHRQTHSQHMLCFIMLR